MQSVCVFCGSHRGRRPEYFHAAAQCGRLLAERGLTVVYGGGSVGLMGALADAALEAGGRVVGVIPRRLARKELMHCNVQTMYVVQSMHERKALMARLADAFVALPGGLGTLEELFEVVTWAQLGYHRKPIGLLNTCGYFEPLLALLDHAVAEGFVRPEHRGLVVVADDPATLLDRLLHHEMPKAALWLREGET